MTKIVHAGTSKVYELISLDTFTKLQEMFPKLKTLKRKV